VGLGDSAKRAPSDIPEAVNLGSRLGKRVRPIGKQVVVAIEDQRLPKESAQRQILAGMLTEVGAKQHR
jgi:hypothetical protein